MMVELVPFIPVFICANADACSISFQGTMANNIKQNNAC